MKKLILFVIFATFLNTVYAQKHDNIWMLGNEYTSSAVLDFSNDSLHIDSVVRNMTVFRNLYSMSDSLGNLIFYTNGIKINNANYQLMQNGDSLNPGQVANDFRNIGYPMSNGAISIAHPLQANKYYLFHQSNTYASDILGMGEHLYYTLIDMSNGLGQVEKKNQILVSDSIIQGQLQMVKHANGRDWWLVQPMAWSNGYYTFLITGDSILLTHKQYIGNVIMFGNPTWLGQSVFSPDGGKYARYDWKNDIDILNFNRCTGLFSNPIHITIQDTIDIFGGTFTGVAISPSSQYLYISSYHLLYQFDLWASNITASKDTVAVHDGYAAFGAIPTVFKCLKLAIDGKIYIMTDMNYCHSVEFPDSSGTNCNVQQRSVTIDNYYGPPYLPNFPHYRTPALAGSPCDTLTSVAEITIQAADIKLYPNPATNNITLESTQPLKQGTLIAVYNALGQEVLQQKISRETTLLELNISNLQDGVYIIQIQKDKQSVSKVFVVSKK